MKTLTFGDWNSYPLIFLVPQMREKEIKKEYLDRFEIPYKHVKCISLHHEGKKTPIKTIKSYLSDHVIPELERSKARYIVVADAEYFKQLTGAAKAEASLGYVLPCKFQKQDYPWHVVYAPSTRVIFYDPAKTREKIALALEALLAHIRGKYRPPGEGIIHFAEYPKTDEEIQSWLDRLLEMNRDLAIDTETFHLQHHKAGLGSIAFGWSKHEGIAFPVDYEELSPEAAQETGLYGRRHPNLKRREMLRRFFVKLHMSKGRKAIYHNIGFDVYNLVYQLFMKDLLDTEGMLFGMRVMLSNWDDTQLITYLATNTCAGNKLGLKANAQEFAGDYALDDPDDDSESIKDILKIPLQKLLEYNLVDVLCTWFVREKHWDQMVADQQLELYEKLFKPAMWDIIQMQLTGLPLNMKRVKEVQIRLERIEKDAMDRIQSSPLVRQFTKFLQRQHVDKRNAKLKKKRITLDDEEVQQVTFNPNSDPQLRDLIYRVMQMPVIDLTDSKLPSTRAKTLNKLINHVRNQEEEELLQALIDYGAVNKQLTSFIPAFLDAAEGPDGWHYLVGSFKLGGTVSGRLSSKKPNLQNLPANITMKISQTLLDQFPDLERFVKKGVLHLGKLIKSCFEAPPGWVIIGLDFDSLEDRIDALITKDPNKLKVYIDGYDGHSLRAFAYFSHMMPDIQGDSVESINSIQDKYPDLRQASKAPTFAKTYQGTWRTLMNNCGFPEEEAKRIDAEYERLYQHSIQWKQNKLDQAARDGYATVAFGLRVRTPLLAQVVRGTSRTPHEAEAEGRTVGNAHGQSYGLLNTRAGVEFMGGVRNSAFRHDIRPCAHIHDAQYYLIRANIDVLLYVNERLVQAARWQELPELQHEKVRLGGSLSVFWPDWSHDIPIPNGADEAAVYAALEARLERRVEQHDPATH